MSAKLTWREQLDQSTPKSENLTWQSVAVTKEMREDLNGHRGAVLWFTGLSGSGKSTLANAVTAALHDQKVRTYMLDGDNIRHGLNRDLGFSPEDREENIRRIGEVAHLFADAGCVVTTAFISPYVRDRDMARRIAGGAFIEVYVCPPLEVCEERDPKGLYKKARSGEIPNFTGISAPYEAPPSPELEINTGEMTVEEAAEKVVAYLREHGIIR